MYPNHSGGQNTPPPAQASYHYPPPPSQAPPPQQAAYPPASQPPTTLPSLSERYPQQPPPDMALHHPATPQYPPQPPPGYPPQQAHYHQPPYRTHDPYRGPPPPHGAHPYPYPPQQHQPAPRQRTAIACRYCRRRKIRCSGFDQSEDGRCANCQRFSQECVFTPVSAQTQAFVPVHAVYGRGQHSQGQQLYGAYGQPLPPPQPGQPDPYASRPPQPYTLPSPTGPHPGQHPHYQQQQPPPQSHAQHYPPPPAQAPVPGYDDRNVVNGNRKRPSGEPHTPTIPPSNPATVPNGAHADSYRYPDPTTLGAPPVSPASSVSHQSGASAPVPQPYYGSQPPQPRNSPPLAAPYAHEPRASASPNSTTAAGSNATQYPPYPGEQKLAPPSNRSDGRTPPPASTPGGTPTTATASAGGAPRPGMSISSIVSGDAASPGTRSARDQDMLKRLGK
ncbi:hypothetical protein E6O75_ATG06690 [Venturia nashicola]|uniref:Zn(2)-C6 fungal-type domain-containing protein n=1 Tax=Venturia nashicola TaxID=86259 RepID=A0A4Z1NW76_9PEZI|nr:hypothetical protein E6O75_ATG06690 [Venturia nashicola]